MKTTDNEKKSYFEKKSKDELIEICLSDSDDCPYAAFLVLETIDQRDINQQLGAIIEGWKGTNETAKTLHRMLREVINDLEGGYLRNERLETLLHEIKVTRKELNSFAKEIRAKIEIERPEDALIEVLNQNLRYTKVKRN